MGPREFFDEVCGLKTPELPPRFRFRKLGYGIWAVYLWYLQGVCIGSVRKKDRDAKAADTCWKASVYAPEDALYNENPRTYQNWEAANAPTEKGGFRTRKEAGAWIVERSLQIGRLWEERLKLLSPLEQLAECAE